jgi:hypothetical protein
MDFLFQLFACFFAAAAGPKAPHEPVVIILD